MIHTDGKPTIVSDRINAARDERLNRVFGIKPEEDIVVTDTMEYGAWRVIRELRSGLASREHIRTKNDVLLVLKELEDQYADLCRG